MIPDFEPDENLPPGIHLVSWGVFANHFGWNSHRTGLLTGLEAGIQCLQIAGCSTLFVDGSFVTKKELPGDFDAAWDPTGVDLASLMIAEPVFFDFRNFRATQKAKFGGEFFPSSTKTGSVGDTFLEFFQKDKNTAAPKGIIQINI
ncbi:hypothetical protein [uncultured Gimesia sp.]|uniref:DUF6932 family protein n=1 Tax=uncultured Gimesia sp. TaxID=1678688 RepID=UPI0030DAC971